MFSARFETRERIVAEGFPERLTAFRAALVVQGFRSKDGDASGRRFKRESARGIFAVHLGHMSELELIWDDTELVVKASAHGHRNRLLICGGMLLALPVVYGQLLPPTQNGGQLEQILPALWIAGIVISVTLLALRADMKRLKRHLTWFTQELAGVEPSV